MRLTVLLTAMIWPFSVAAAPPDADVERFVRDFAPTGLAVVVIRDGEVALMQGTGVRRAGRPERVGIDTGFTIASMGKAFVAAGLAALVEDGKLSWDDPVIRHLPEFRTAEPYVTENLTIRDLLTHRSGLPLGAGDLLAWPDGTATPSEAVAAVAHLPIEAFRDRFVYSNTMYRVAGAVIETHAGKNWFDFIGERILAPLGMTGCSPDPRKADPKNIAVQHVRDRRTNRVTPLLRLEEYPDPAGGMVCTIADLAIWARFQLSDGASDQGVRLFSADVMRELHRGVTPRRVSGIQRRLAGANFGLYALGWEVSDFHGALLIEHGGQSSGGLSHIAILPQRRAAVAVLANENGAPVSVLSYQILSRIAAGEAAPDWIGDVANRSRETAAAPPQSGPASSEDEQPQGAPRSPLKDYAGVYRDPWYGDIRVSLDRRGLRIHLTRSRLLNGPLETIGGDKFLARWPDRGLQADAIVTFTRDGAGNVAGMRLKAASPETDFSYDYHNLSPVRVR